MRIIQNLPKELIEHIKSFITDEISGLLKINVHPKYDFVNHTPISWRIRNRNLRHFY